MTTKRQISAIIAYTLLAYACGSATPMDVLDSTVDGGDGSTRDGGAQDATATSDSIVVQPDATVGDSAVGDSSVVPCTATEYRNSAGICTTTTVCSEIQYQSTAPTATSDRVCSSLTVCNESQYQSTAPTATSDRVCSSLTACNETQFQSTAPTATSDRVCSSLTACSESQYQSAAPTATSDRVCSPISMCSESQYQSAAPTATSDRVCARLTACSETQYQSTAPTATSDRVCSPITVCNSTTQYESTAPTATSDRVCTNCGAGRANCDGNGANQCEVDLTGDPQNCNACGQVCSGGTPYCASSACAARSFSTSYVDQLGPNQQYTRCASVQTTATTATCTGPVIRYGTVEGGLPANHGSWSQYGNIYCQQMGYTSLNSITTAQMSTPAPAPQGWLFPCLGYDENVWHWCDWQDGTWRNQSLDYHSSLTGITSITCNR